MAKADQPTSNQTTHKRGIQAARSELQRWTSVKLPEAGIEAAILAYLEATKVTQEQTEIKTECLEAKKVAQENIHV